MRHDQIAAKDTYSVVDIAAVWPSGLQLAALPLSEVQAGAEREHLAPTPAAPDVPIAVGKLIVTAYAALIGAFAFATSGSSEAVYALVIAALFVVMFFTVPAIILRVEPDAGRRRSFEAFMRDGMDTLTGQTSGGAALAQMLIVPVCLTLGVFAMGIAVTFIF